MLGKGPAPLHNVHSYKDKPCARGRGLSQSCCRTPCGGRGTSRGVILGVLFGVWRLCGRGSCELGRVGQLGQPAHNGALAPKKRPSLAALARLRYSQITTCHCRFRCSLTCLQIFPNKERSCKHGNQLSGLWQTAASAQQEPAQPAEEGVTRPVAAPTLKLN